jgi:hypothetical protein
MPGLCAHKMQPISIMLVVDNFGVKYVNKEDLEHLIMSIKKLINSPKIGSVA